MIWEGFVRLIFSSKAMDHLCGRWEKISERHIGNILQGQAVNGKERPSHIDT